MIKANAHYPMIILHTRVTKNVDTNIRSNELDSFHQKFGDKTFSVINISFDYQAIKKYFKNN
jgi:hypothetical protein